MYTDKEKRLRGIIEATNTKLHGLLYNLCRDKHMTAEIIQQVYIKIWENLDNIDNDDKIFPLLMQYSRNAFLNELKRSRVRQKVYNAFPAGEEWDISNEEIFLNKEQYGRIQTAISKLPRQQQLIFRMHKEQAMPYRQISAHLNISPGTIEKQMNRALKFLRTELEEMKRGSYTVTALLLIYLTAWRFI